jgi:hypothetical protein
MATAAERSSAARIAVNVSWARTPNRAERTAPGHRSSPVSYDYWLAKIKAEGLVRPKDIPAAAGNAHRAYMQQLSKKAAAARRRKKAGKPAA